MNKQANPQRFYFCEAPDMRADGSLARGQHDSLGNWAQAGTRLTRVVGVTDMYAVFDSR